MIRRTLIAILSAVTLFVVFTMTLGDAMDHAWKDSTQRQIDSATAHCAVVWVEHKVRPPAPDEVLARGCR